MTFDKWVKKNIGRGIDYDGTYGVQCVDLAKHYIKNVLGITPQSIGNAIEYYNKRKTSEYLTKNFKWIDNTAEFIPKKGDLCVFTSRSGHGHISVATGKGTTSYFYSYDQNFPKAKHEPMTLIKHSYNSFLGVLRPLNQANIGAEKKKPTPTKKVAYFKLYKGKSDSLVDALEAVGAKSDFSYRKKVASKNKIKDYKGTAEQNNKLLALLKKGKLIKP
ncbi:CHAP domain-containing protein [Eubacterium sp.]|uniref:CHAP domain-containing protein n=1 Tax=Eubacterium sp. TaxID=142586 RepID=UPI0025BB9117|nr:CHAP domain-containing protein [Eubacterium sp.]